MEHNAARVYLPERRSEPRLMVNRPCRCKFSLDRFKGSYDITIRDRTGKSMSLLVEKNSGILPMLRSSPVTHLMYYPSDTGFPVIHIGASVRHVTNQEGTAEKGYCLVGLEFLPVGEAF
ncbi:MAG: hypothetical protein JRJ03_19320 [Deltaproteobacteria bacterium]|nr:hypothetical protein [Deltaproteobacteria bacterium]